MTCLRNVRGFFQKQFRFMKISLSKTPRAFLRHLRNTNQPTRANHRKLSQTNNRSTSIFAFNRIFKHLRTFSEIRRPSNAVTGAYGARTLDRTVCYSNTIPLYSSPTLRAGLGGLQPAGTNQPEAQIRYVILIFLKSSKQWARSSNCMIHRF